MFSQNQLQVKNSPSKMLQNFVHHIEKKDTEGTANYVSGMVNFFAKPRQIKSIEELTKTVVVKVQKVTPKAILERLGRQKDSLKTKYRRVESVQNSNEILAQEMKIVAKRKKAKVETIPKKETNFDGQFEKDICGKRNKTKSGRASEEKAGRYYSENYFPTALTKVHSFCENTGDKIQQHSYLCQSSNTHKNRTRNFTEDSTNCSTYCVNCNNMSVVQRIDYNTNAFTAAILQDLLEPESDCLDW
ncbi:uncharacterized protein LOC129958877 [Argiope bruennichi]|uniref:uncharacterized protein LOC129958877 n=1 Tax=Argiope bruennichi TaxID=94029 RepID=UPI002494EFF9|nr:uncharacterized protein LOC129958877 [Argiope bruennichi]